MLPERLVELDDALADAVDIKVAGCRSAPTSFARHVVSANCDGHGEGIGSA